MELNELDLQPVRRQPLSQSVYEKLKLSILNHEIEAGTKLSETSVAKQVGTSPTPVREAFRLLAAEGLVRIEPWKGAIVQSYSEDEIRDVFQCREALELLALDLTIDKLKKSENLGRELAKIDKELFDSENTALPFSFASITSEIHDYWITGSGNCRLIGLMDSLNDVLLHDRNVSAMDEKRRGEIISEHKEILSAIKNLDKEAAKQALKVHIQNGLAYSLNKMNSN